MKIIKLLLTLLLLGCETNDNKIPTDPNQEEIPVLTERYAYNFYLVAVRENWQKIDFEYTVFYEFEVSEKLQLALLYSIGKTEYPTYQQFLEIVNLQKQ